MTLYTDTLSGGDHRIFVRAKDAAGNWGAPTVVDIEIVDWQEGAWTTTGGDPRRSGRSETTLTPPLVHRWSTPMKEIEFMAPPIISNSRIFVAWRDFQGKTWVSAFQLWNGEPIWSRMLTEEGITNPPTYAYGRIFTQVTGMNTGAKAFAIDPEDGAVLWEQVVAAQSQWSMYGAPAAYRGLVMFPAEYRLLALDALDGGVAWSDFAPGSQSWSTSVDESGGYSFGSGVLAAFDVDTGLRRWFDQLVFDYPQDLRNVPVIDDETGDILLASSFRLARVDPGTREVRWNVEGQFQSLPAIDGTTLYLSAPGAFNAHDVETGVRKWQVFLGEGVADNTIVTPGYAVVEGYLDTYLVDISRRDVVWNAGIGGEIAVADGTLLIAKRSEYDGTGGGLHAYIGMNRVGSEYNPELPGEIALEPAYPNPFNPSTTIRFSLPLSTHATLTVFNAQGQKVVVLVDDRLSAGSHEVVFDAKSLSSGAYFARLTVGDRSTTRPLLLAK